ncbi:outer membrane beta-barrel protein [Spirosoma sp. HMF4905]|uniref:Outer membrane beta-barrel protein n=1 Tax=Spirosoma arboris TaxID=2682092 RepID=A0A7K1SP88_9BACT|nr:porin family protein [Spirosoma arboris]MVM35609.1 outer membrane beta-barrel protein [Spirosoma arboris]
MKSFYSVLALILLSVSWAFAQTGSATGSSSTTSPNRQQELYDQYHGITKKPSTVTPVKAPAPASTANRVDQQRSTNKPTTKQASQQPSVTATPAQPTETANRPQRVVASSGTSGTRIGIRAGVTYPVFTETQPGFDPAIGFVGGLTFNFGAGHVSFQPEVNYTRYSTKVTDFGTYTQAVDGLEVPLFLKLSTGTYAGNRFFLNVGPYATYAMSASTNGKKESLDGKPGRFGFGAGAGLGAAIKAGPGHVTLEVRGLYPLGNVDNGFSTDSKEIFGQGTLGYIFPLGSR